MEKKIAKKPESEAVVARRAKVAKVRRERTRLALTKAAFDLLGHVNGKINNIDAVVAQAGVTRGTFYNHYTGLEDLLSGLSKEITHDFNRSVLQYIGELDHAPEQCAIFLKAYLQGTLANAEWGWSMVNLSLYGPFLGAAALRMSEANILRGKDAGVYSCMSPLAGRDLAQGALLAGMKTLLQEGETDGYIVSIVHGILMGLGVPDVQARQLAETKLPNNVTAVIESLRTT